MEELLCHVQQTSKETLKTEVLSFISGDLSGALFA